MAGKCRYAESCGLDAVTGYNYHRNIINSNIINIYPFEDLVRDHVVTRNAFSEYCSTPPVCPLVIGRLGLPSVGELYGPARTTGTAPIMLLTEPDAERKYTISA